jgi:hypothetical protein
MDIEIAERHLAQAEEHVALGERNIARQKGIITRLKAGGHDTAEARELLEAFENMQIQHVAHRDRLMKEISDAHRS